MRIQLEKHPSAQARQFLQDELLAFNEQHVGPDNYEPLYAMLRDGDGAVCGGLMGETFWQWFHINTLWIAEEQRGQGWGSQLLQQAEEEAIRRGCRAAFVDTFDFQAPDFYKRHGYETWGQLDDLPPGHRRIFFQKPLISNTA